ncbi:MAG: SAM-dependent methyltransferase [Micrococcales bacterium]|nr:SAM-dependent methyltransferase [Micrococcales bacterium]
MGPLPWRVAWHEALYAAERGFYLTRGGPSSHFTTAAHGPTGAVLADGLLRLWHRTHRDRPRVIVDVGAGQGELATHLLHALTGPPPDGSRLSAAAESHRTPRLLAVDVVARPDGLDARIDWLRSPGGAALPDELTGLSGALVIGHEWLDVIPCTIAQVDASGSPREVLVDSAGHESLGGPLGGAEREWAERHWPGIRPGGRIEIGLTRDEVWFTLVSRVRDGLLVAVDYGHVGGERPNGGTLTAYAHGAEITPVPDGSCDLTAHVAMDTLEHDELIRQRDVLRDLGLRGLTPDVALATTDPPGYLATLARCSAEARLIARGGFGDYWWAVRHVAHLDVA